jgi:signal transduction histidine kinase
LDGVLALVKGDLLARSIALETAIEAKLPPVAGNKTQLQQVLLNLIANAAEAMDEVVVKTRRLRIGAVRDGEAVLITLQDTGPGIDPRLAERMFEPFVTTKSKGTGLGLSICRSIVEAHGGKLLFMAANPHGAVVQVTLPIAEAT